MQAPDDAELAAAVDASVRRPLRRVQVDWYGDGTYAHPHSDLTGMVRAVEVERALTTDLPAEAGLIDGYVSAQATLELEGVASPTGPRAADLLAPYDRSSPLWSERKVGRDVRIDMGLATRAGPRLLRQLTGPIRSVRADQGTRRVEIEALDPSERLRALVTLPVGAMDGPTHKADPHGYPWLTNSHWVIDYVLRRNGIYASPPPHPEAILSATLHGSHVAEIAAQTFDPAPHTRATDYAGRWYQLEGHPFGMLHPAGSWNGTPYVGHVATDLVVPAAGMGLGMCAWVWCGEGLAEDRNTEGTGNRVLARVHLGPNDFMVPRVEEDGRVGFRYETATATSQLLVPSLGDTGLLGWKYVGFWVQFISPGLANLYVRVEGNTWRFTSPVNLDWENYGELYPRTRAMLYYPVPMTNVSIWWGEPPPFDGSPWPGEIHTSQASIDRGLNELTHLPDIAAQDSWTVLQDVTAAEFGIIGFDEWGQPFFRNRASVVSDTTSIEKIYTTDKSIKELAAEVSTDTVRNVIGWEAEAAYTSIGTTTVAFEAETYDQFNVIPGVTQFEIPIPPMMVVPEEYEVPQLTPEQWETFKDQIVWGYVAYFPTGQGLVPSSEVNIYWSLIAPRTGLLTIENLSPRRFELRLPDTDQNEPGEPALRLYGSPIVAQPKTLGERVRPGSVQVYGERGYRLPESPWRQLDGPSSAVAGSLLANLAYPLPVIEDVSAIGDPRVQLGDTVLLRDRDKLTVPATVVKSSRRLDESGLVDVVAVRPLAPPGFGLLDDPDLGRLDDTLTLAS